MDQSQMLSIVGGIYDKLVGDVADVVIARLKAETKAELSLAPETLQSSVLSLVENNTDIRDAIRDIVDDKINDIDLDDLKQFSSLEDRVSELESNESANIDADDDTFADAVRSVIRNNI